MTSSMQRRSFLTLLGGAAAAWPLAARAQDRSLPVVGYLGNGSPEADAYRAAAFRRGLSEAGYVEGRNVAIEFRWAHNDDARLPELAADLVRRQVTVLAALNTTVTVAAKAATTTIPIVFMTGGDPAQMGLVASFNRPGGNITGISNMVVALGAKRLGLLHELLPAAARFGMFLGPPNPLVETHITVAQAAAAAIGRQIEFFNASTNREIDAAFASVVQKRIDALLVPPVQLFIDRRAQIVTLAVLHRLPAMYAARELVEVGGLMSYGPEQSDQFRLAGIYAGRILKGEKPSDLPVMQPTKFEFVINLHAAQLLGLDIPPGVLAIADEVVE